MKAIIQSYFWWPNVDKHLERCVQNAWTVRQTLKNAPLTAPLHLWLWLAKPWQHPEVDTGGIRGLLGAEKKLPDN